MVSVILTKNDKVLGEEGKIVEVSAGYARNYLVPKELAILATKSNKAHYEAIQKAQAKKIAQRVESENSVKAKIEGNFISVTVKAGENKKLFGSVTNDMIAKALFAQQEVEIDKRRITIPAPIKMTGKFTYLAKLQYSVVAEGKIEVIADKVIEEKEEVVEAVEVAEAVETVEEVVAETAEVTEEVEVAKEEA